MNNENDGGSHFEGKIKKSFYKKNWMFFRIYEAVNWHTDNGEHWVMESWTREALMDHDSMSYYYHPFEDGCCRMQLAMALAFRPYRRRRNLERAWARSQRASPGLTLLAGQRLVWSAAANTVKSNFIWPEKVLIYVTGSNEIPF